MTPRFTPPPFSEDFDAPSRSFSPSWRWPRSPPAAALDRHARHRDEHDRCCCCRNITDRARRSLRRDCDPPRRNNRDDGPHRPQ